VPNIVYGFLSWEKKNDHWWDHRDEFAFSSADDYEAAAISFLTMIPIDTVVECVRRNGDIIRVDLSTDEFAVCDRDGILNSPW
jgi:pyocin large subunit-like protein